MARLATQEKPQLVDGSADDVPDTILEYSTNIAEQERPPILPIGEYRAQVTGVQKKYVSSTGKPFLLIKFSVGADDLPATLIEELGTQDPIDVFYMLFGCEDIPASKFEMHKFCAAVGAPMSNRIDVRDFMDQVARIQVDHRTGPDGEPSPKVRRVIKD